MPPASTTTDEDATLFESVVVPRYTSLFTRLILDSLAPDGVQTVLDVGCGTGHPTGEMVERLPEGSRVIAIDRDPALLDVARRRCHGLVGTRVFFKVSDAERLAFGDEVFDAAVGNLVLAQAEEPARVLSELRRVLRPQGHLLLTRPLAGTFQEVFDMFREVALRHDLAGLRERLELIEARYPTEGAFAAQVRAAGFDAVEVRRETLGLPFRNAAEAFRDDVVRIVALPEWRWIAGLDASGLARLEEVERSLEVYFGGGPLSLTVEAGLVSARRPS